ncbi:MAG: phage GP46 family protein [Dichotomicrobium sp.]
MSEFTDLDFERDADGVYDLVVDPDTGDFKVTGGMRPALFISLFSDRRARPDEVADPLKRRGWIGDLYAEIPGDAHGSGLWLYNQRRLTADVRQALRLEALNSLAWLLQDRLVQSVDAEVIHDPAARSLELRTSLTVADGGVSRTSFELWEHTRAGELARTT